MNRPIFENPQLDGTTFHLTGENGIGVILFHGFTSTTVEVRPIGEYLNSAGYSVLAPLLPGHGTRPEDASKVKFTDWLTTAEDAYQSMAPSCRQIFVGGESMGALLALHLAKVHPEIGGILAYAPAIHIKGQWRAPLLAPFLKIRAKYYLSDEPAAPDPDMLPWQGYNVIPVPAAAQFYYLQRQINRELSDINQPLLAFQGKLDGTIIPEGANTLISNIQSVDKQLVWLDNSGHTLLLGKEHLLVYEKSLEFLRRVTKQSVPGFLWLQHENL